MSAIYRAAVILSRRIDATTKGKEKSGKEGNERMKGSCTSNVGEGGVVGLKDEKAWRRACGPRQVGVSFWRRMLFTRL